MKSAAWCERLLKLCFVRESVKVHLTYDSLKSESQTVKSGTEYREKKESLLVDRPVLSS
jgi:hypothetical protein